jgi:hypothetical protein
MLTKPDLIGQIVAVATSARKYGIAAHERLTGQLGARISDCRTKEPFDGHHPVDINPHQIMRAWAGRYRPERHYMRGRGPASKRNQSQGAGP